MANPALLPLPTVKQRVHAEGVRAVARTMEAISGFNYVAGIFYSDPGAAMLARQQEAEKLMRAASWDMRRAMFTVVAADAEDVADDVLERQRQAQGLDLEAGDDAGEPTFPPHGDTAWEVEYWRTRAFPVVCAWCGLEMVKGNPALPVSHGVCATCEPKLTAPGAA